MKKSFIPPSIQILIYPTLVLMVLVVLILIVINFGFSQISKQRQAMAETAQNEKILAEKEAILSEVSGTVVANANSVSLALPEDNPALFIISQLKLLALSKSVVLKNIKVGAGTEETSLLRVSLSFNADGQTVNVLDFLNSIENVSPIITIEKVKMSQIGGILSADTTIRGYWSALPKTLPKITEPLKNLSDAEKDVLDKILALTPPSFAEIIPAQASARDNPF